jgi:uncharacterized protein
MELKNLNHTEARTNLENLAVMLTRNCQMNCRYCFIKRNQPDMGQSTLFRAIDLLLTSPLEETELQFFGGEPLLRWDLVKKGIIYAQNKSREKGKKMRYLLTTNGLLLDGEKLDFLKQYKTTVMFSFDGNEKTLAENRPLINQKKYPSKILIKNLRNLIQNKKIDYFVNLTFLPKNLKHLKENIDYLLNLEAYNIQLSYAIGTYWPPQCISFYLKLLNDFVKIPNLNLRNLDNASEPVLASPQILIDSSGKIYLGCAAVLEKNYPKLNQSFYFSHLQNTKNIFLLKRTKEEQLEFLNKVKPKFNQKLKKVVQNNLEFGELLGNFFKREILHKKNNFVNSLMIMTTYSCQLICNYCQVKQSTLTMPVQTLFKAIDFLFTSKSPEVQLRFWGGEPLLRWDFIKEGIYYGKKQSRKLGKTIKFMITTNGLLLDKSKLDFLNNHPVEIMFSLDGDEENNQKHRIPRNNQKIYGQLLKNLKLLVKSGLPYFVNMVVTPLNVKNLFSNLLFLKNLGIKRIQICHQVTNLWPEEKIKIYLEQLGKIKNDSRLSEIIMNFVNRSEPQFLSNELIADTDGKIYFDGSIFLEKKYPELRKACYLGDVFSLNNIDAFYRNKDDIYDIFKENALPFGNKIFLNNIYLGRKLAHFFDNFFYEASTLKDDENPFFVNFLKNEFLLQKNLVEQLKINALFFHLKGSCLNNCIFCRRMDNPWTDFFEAVEEFPLNKKLKFEKLCLIGNEPLLHPKILDIISIAKKNGFKKIEIMTSGEPLADKFFLIELIKRGTTSFSIPIFGSKAEIHDSIVQRSGSFKELIAGLYNLKKNKKVKVFIHSNLLKQNLADLPALEKLITKKFDFPFVVLPTRTKFSNLSFKEFTPSYPELTAVLKERINSLFGFPYCVSGAVQRKISFGKISDSMKLYFIHQRFVKSKNCQNCLYLKNCLGVFKDYLKIYPDKYFSRYGKFKS